MINQHLVTLADGSFLKCKVIPPASLHASFSVEIRHYTPKKTVVLLSSTPPRGLYLHCFIYLFNN
jgi:hypothetical protein